MVAIKLKAFESDLKTSDLKFENHQSFAPLKLGQKSHKWQQNRYITQI